MARTIYLAVDEEVLSAIQKLRHFGEREILIVAPAGARLFRNLTGLKLLKNEAEKFEKSISIATADERGKVLAARAGIRIIAAFPGKFTDAAGIMPARTVSKRMGDIMVRPIKAPAADDGEKYAAPEVAAGPKKQESLEDLIGPQSRDAADIKIPEPVKIPMPPLRYTVLPAAVVVLVLVLLSIFVLPSAAISIQARTEPVTRDLEIQVDGHAGVPDIQSLTIPGKLITDKVEDSKTYQSTGIKNIGEKASGFVTLYNFSKTTLILRKGTTRLESNGKVYYFLQDVGNIRPTGRIGADLEIDSTSLIDPVPIVAAEAGEDSNVAAGSRFEIFNEVFGHQPEVLYAVNSNPVSGGTNKQLKIISAADVDAARKDLKAALIEKFTAQTKSRLTLNARLADNAFSLAVSKEQLSSPVDSEKESFTLGQTADVTALIYDEMEVRSLITERIVRLLPDNKFLLPAEQQKLTAQFVSLDLVAGVGTLRAHFESEVRYKINTDFLSRSLPGKNATQVKEILLSRPEIKDVQVDFSPFWVTSVPRFGNKINFKIQQ